MRSRHGILLRRAALMGWLFVPMLLVFQLLANPSTAVVASVGVLEDPQADRDAVAPEPAENSPRVDQTADEFTSAVNEAEAIWPPLPPDVASVDLPTTPDVPEEFTLTTQQLGLGRSIWLARPAGQTTVTVPVPEGMVLVEFNTTLVVPSGLHETYVSIAVNGEVVWAETVSGGTRQAITAAIEPVAGDVIIDITAEEYFAGAECTSAVIEPRAAELLEPTFELRAQPTLPSTVSEFFPAIIDRFDIYVPTTRTAGVDEAVLVLATELSKLYPNLPAFEVHPLTTDIAGQIDPDPFVRSIALSESDQGSVSVVSDTRVAYLNISGPTHHLTSVAASIDSPELGLITASEVDTVGSRIDKESVMSQRQTLREAGIRNLEASGGVRLRLAMPLPQARFGQPVEEIRVRLGGVVFHTGVKVDEPVVTIWVNGDLFGAIDLDESGRFDTEIDISGTSLTRDNLVEIRSDLPLECGDGLPNHELQLDVNSWIEVKHGQTLSVGLERFPQVLLPGFQLDPGDSVAELEVAANLLAAMQFVSPEPIEPHVASWNEIVGSNRPGILVGGTPAQVDLLGLPIQAGSGSMVIDGVSFESGAPYDDVAIMQAIIGPGGQDLLHIRLPGSDVDNVSADTLSFMLSDRSWEVFHGRAYAIHEDKPVVIPVIDPTVVDAALPALREDRTSPIRRSFGGGLLVTLAGCLVFLGVRSANSRLRR